MKVGIVLGSIRQGRFGEQVAHWVADAAANSPDVTYEILDLQEFQVPLLDTATLPGGANKQYADERVTAWSRAVDSCDGYIFVTPEHNHSVPGAMKNAYDSLSDEWAMKPVAFVGYSADGAIRAVEHWRQIVANFSMFDVRNQVALSLFDDATDGTLTPRPQKNTDLTKMLNALEQFLRHHHASQ